MSSLFVFDPRVENFVELMAGLPEDVEVLILDLASNGVEQIAAYLEGRNEFDAIHVISHGSNGRLYLGSDVVDVESVRAQKDLWTMIGHSLTESGDILLYGCNVAAESDGRMFVDQLARITGTDVGASEDVSGTIDNANWTLEYQAGILEEGSLAKLFEGTEWRGLLSETRVNTYTKGNQWKSDVAALPGGGYVVTWESEGQDGNESGIYAQRFSATGARVGSETRVNTSTYRSQHSPAIAALGGGSYVITWSSYGQDSGGYNGHGIYALRFSANGTAMGPEARVNTHTLNDQQQSCVAALSDGGYVIAWHSKWQEDSISEGIYAQRFSANGTPVGPETHVNTYTKGTQNRAAIAALSDGGYVITWCSWGQDGDVGVGIYGQRFAPNGAPLGSETRINTSAAKDSNVKRHAAVGLHDGGYVITWDSYSQDGHIDIYAQRFLANGARFGGETRINSYTSGEQNSPDIAPLRDGGYVIVWQCYDRKDIFAQRFSANGSRVGGENRINKYTSYEQGEPAVVNLSDGGYIVTWNSLSQDGDGCGIYAGRFIVADNYIKNTYYLTENNDDFSDPDTYGSNIIIALGGDDRVLGELGHDTIDGGAGNDRLYGGAGNDKLSGGSGNDTLVGNAGNETLNGGSGSDSMVGGTGNDTYYVDAVGDIVTEAAGAGTDTVFSYLANYTLSSNVENGRVMSTSVANITGNTLNNTLYAGVGNNVLQGGSGIDTVSYAYGVSGTTGVTVNLGVTTAQATGGSGRDTLGGFENVTGSVNADRLTGNSGNNVLNGGRGNDTLIGGARNDVLNGGTGNDYLFGGTGNDKYFVDSTGDRISETSVTMTEIDTVQSYVTWNLGANLENLTLMGSSVVNGTGNSLNNKLSGNSANNVLNGGSGNDKLSGGGGNDNLYGGRGKDSMTGGTGADKFTFNTALGSSNIDIITDFVHGTDKIVLDDDIFTKIGAPGTLLAGAFRKGAGVTTAGDAGDRIILNTTTGALYYDSNGSAAGAAVQFATLTGTSTKTTITASDFLVVG